MESSLSRSSKSGSSSIQVNTKYKGIYRRSDVQVYTEVHRSLHLDVNFINYLKAYVSCNVSELSITTLIAFIIIIIIKDIYISQDR